MIAFGQEKLEEANFTWLLAKSWVEGNINQVKAAFALGFFNLIIFGCYTYGLSLGGVFAHERISKDGGDKIYAAGDVISVFFGIIFGVFSVGMAAPSIKSVNEGRAALANVLAVIRWTPNIILDDKEAPSFDE